MRSETSNGTIVEFFDDTSEKQKQFLDSSYKEMLLSNKKNVKNKEYNTKKIENQETQKSLFIPRIPPPISQSKNLCLKFKNPSNNQQHLQLPSPVIECVEPIIENDSTPTSTANSIFKSEEINKDLSLNYNNAKTISVCDTFQETANHDFFSKS